MAAANPNKNSASGREAPATQAYAPTLSDTDEIATIGRGLYVGGGGTVKCVLSGDVAPVIFVGVPAGVVLPIALKQIYVTGTSANNLLVLY